MKTTLNNNALPILYSLRNCPYAMRARIAIYYSQQPIILRDVVLNNKPEAMLKASPKGTVPVLVLSEQKVIEESLEVMLWALGSNDPDNFLQSHNDEALTQMLTVIARFDHDFKACLEAYKCAKRYHEGDLIQHRQACEVHIQDLEQRLTQHQFLMSSTPSLMDIALLPFIRQFARVERQWYLQSPYPRLRKWLNNYLQSPMFTKVMAKFPLWSPGHEAVIFGPSICGKV
ncbi:MAG: glutathione S-transferase [Colwellia sp.]|nr:glutathione S-transferase [Colwellia sp.]MCW8863287.1 glutathione S-transferase [Colwellia sp.]MCW9081270.1 glutathione S-transferase [Colwellia sp.]